MELQPYLLDAMITLADQQPVSGHTPGHKNGLLLPEQLRLLWGDRFAAYDFTELPGLDNLHFASGCIEQSQQQVAAYCGAARSYYLVNGTSGGLQAAIMATCYQQQVFVPRHAHRSIYHSLILAQAQPIYLPVVIDEATSLPLGIDPAVLKQYIARYPQCKRLIMVHPTYQGITWKNQTCFAVAKEHQLTVITDEAHGSHLLFHSALPPSSLTLGSDLVVQSWHKTLPVLTQGSVLHVGCHYQGPELDSYLSLLQTTSPSYLLLASLETAGITMAQQGGEIMQQSLHTIASLHQYIYQQLTTISLLWQPEWQQDPFKLYLCSRRLTGAQLEKHLREQFAIYPEMHDNNGCLLMLPLQLTTAWLQELQQALAAIDEASLDLPPIVPKANFYCTTLPQEVLPLNKAFFAPKRTITWQKAAGEVAGQFILRYPPGIPLLVPGEKITASLIANWLQSGGKADEPLIVLA